ncbi:MAG: hypothetical protein U1E30_04595 [Rhodoblastus sp.]
MARQARQQYAYEDRLAVMRLQLDRVTSRQLLDQDLFEGKVQHLIAREAQLETRTAIVAALSERIGVSPSRRRPRIAPASAKPTPRTARTPHGAHATPAAGGPETKANGFAPLPQPMDDLPFKPEKPRPDGFELRGQPLRSSALPAERNRLLDEAADAEMSTHARIELLAASRSYRTPAGVRAGLAAGPAKRKAEELEAVIAETGPSASRLKASKAAAVGGPFVPAALGGLRHAERQLAKVLGAFVALDRIRRVLPYVPVRKPLSGQPEITSTFGYRSDPFLGRPALHSGLDMRWRETGTPARDGWRQGGHRRLERRLRQSCRNRVRNGSSTRYGHLSAILVAEGQTAWRREKWSARRSDRPLDRPALAL